MKVSFPQKNNFDTLTANLLNVGTVNNPVGGLALQYAGATRILLGATYVHFYDHLRLANNQGIIDTNDNMVLLPDHVGGITSLADVANSPTFNGIPVTARYLEGVANKQFVPCIPLGDFSNNPWEWTLSSYTATNLGADDLDFIFIVPLPTNLYSKRLYLKNVIVAVQDADIGDYVTNVTVEGIKLGSNITLNTSIVDIDTPGDPEIVFTAVDLSGYSQALVQLDCVNTDALDLNIAYVLIEAYYDT